MAFVPFAQGGARLFVIPGKRVEGLFRQTFQDTLPRGSQQAVAALDVMIQKRERLARLQPQAYLAQLHRHGIDVHAIHATAHDITQGMAKGCRGGFFITRTQRGQPFGQTLGGRQQKMPAATGRVADFQVEQGGFGGFHAASAPDCSADDRLKGGIQQAVNKLGGRVIGTCGLPVVSGGGVQTELAVFHNRMQLQQGFIHGTKFPRPQMAVIHRASPPFPDRKGQFPYSPEQVGIAQAAWRNIRHGLVRPQKTAQRGKAQFRTAHALKPVHNQLDAFIQVAVSVARYACGKFAQARQGIGTLVAIPADWRGLRAMQHLPIFQHKEKNDAIDKTQELAKILPPSQ